MSTHTPTRYFKRTYSVIAEQFLPEEGKPLPDRVFYLGDTSWQLNTRESWLSNEILSDGVQFPKPGDYIVRSNAGEVFCMTEREFNETFVTFNEREER